MLQAFADQPAPDFARWTGPLVADVISAGYARIVSDQAATAALARCNALLWRQLLSRANDAEAYVRDLMRLSGRAGLEPRAVERINEQVVDELMGVIAGRYTRSPRHAAALSFEVASAACRLTRALSRPAEPPRSQPRQMALAKRGA